MTASPAGRRGRSPWLWLLAALLLTPVVELLVIVAVADRIGGWTLLLLAAAAVAGVLILSRGGKATFRRVREVGRSGRTPTRELADAFLTVLGGVLLLVPGFVTDVLALVCLVPPLRWAARVALLALLGRWASRTAVRFGVAGVVDRGRVVPGSVVPPGPGTNRSRPRDAEPGAGGPPLLEGRVLPDPPSGGDDDRPRPGS